MKPSIVPDSGEYESPQTILDALHLGPRDFGGVRSQLIPISDAVLFEDLLSEMARAAKLVGNGVVQLYCDAHSANLAEPIFGQSARMTVLSDPAAAPLVELSDSISVEAMAGGLRCFVIVSSDYAVAALCLSSNGGHSWRGGWTGDRAHAIEVARFLLAGTPRLNAIPDANGTDSAQQTALAGHLMAFYANCNMRRRKALSAEKGDLFSVLQILKAISSRRRSHDVLFVFVEEIATVVASDRCSVVRVRGASGTVLASHDSATVADLDIDLAKYPELERACALESRLVINHATRNPVTESVREHLVKAGIGNILVVPIVLHDPHVGSLLLRVARRRAPFTEREVGFCEIVAEAASNALERAHLFDSIQDANERLERLAVTDGLTGLHNYRFFKGRLAEEFERAKRYKTPVSCIVFDVDDFKAINDRFGHLQGDAVLHEIAQRTRRASRQSDVVARYGGEEFAVIMPQTDRMGSLAQALRICDGVRSNPIQGLPATQRVTVSVGVATLDHDNMESAEDILKAADEACYHAKRRGKDRVVVAGDEES